MAENGKGGQLAVAIVGAASAVGVALVANWHSVFPGKGPTPAPPAPPAPTRPLADAPGPVAVSPIPRAPAASSDFILADSDQVALDAARIVGLSAAQLRLARNEIYARHGFIFHSADLRAYFSRFAWYRPIASTVTLSPVEQANVARLQAAESARPAGG
ncbi:MAG: YARHG domain-containing protein [Pseudomonadota bacterium]